MNQQQPPLTYLATSSSTPINPQPLLEHGESTTAIILSIAMLISILMGSVIRLVHVIGVTRSSR